MSEHEKPQSAVRRRLNDIAHAVDERLPAHYGFIVLVAPEGEESMCNYVSNLPRENAVNVLKEFLIRAGHAEDWMKHLP